jgi:hypothetical protein
MIVKAYGLRDEANDLLDEADRLLHQVMGLSPFTEDDVLYFKQSKRPRAFAIPSADLNERFDATCTFREYPIFSRPDRVAA